jgi:5-methylcytosine-specific restriction endonuclease McrA
MNKPSNRRHQRPRLLVKHFQAKEVLRFLNVHGCHVGPTESFKNIGQAILKFYGLPRKVLGKKNAKKLILRFTFTKKASEEHKRHKTHRSDEYIKYLQSPEWKAFKAIIVQERKNKCEQCESDGKNTCIDLHHITYVRLGHELPQDVKLLCRNCHEAVHQRKFTRQPHNFTQRPHSNSAPLQEVEILNPAILRREAACKYNIV